VQELVQAQAHAQEEEEAAEAVAVVAGVVVQASAPGWVEVVVVRGSALELVLMCC